MTPFSILSKLLKNLLVYYNLFHFIISNVCMPISPVGQHFKIQEGGTWPHLFLHSVCGWAQYLELQWYSVRACWSCRNWGSRTMALLFALVMVEVRFFLSESLYKKHYHRSKTSLFSSSDVSLPLCSLKLLSSCCTCQGILNYQTNVITQVCHVLVKRLQDSGQGLRSMAGMR